MVSRWTPIVGIVGIAGLAGLAACGDDGVGDTGPASSSAAGTTGTTAGSDTTQGPGATGQVDGTGAGTAACSSHTQPAACAAGDPGGGQLCEWVFYYPVSGEGTGRDLACTWGEAAGLCVQALGSEGGTPFGSCGGDGSQPVYWRDNGGTIELVLTDGFATPDGFEACDCHDELPGDGDPDVCCCVCFDGWPT
jgi:hypothetical protein